MSGLAAFANVVDLMAFNCRLAKQSMPGFGAKMRDVDDGSRIICQNLQYFAFSHGFQPFARF